MAECATHLLVPRLQPGNADVLEAPASSSLPAQPEYSAILPLTRLGFVNCMSPVGGWSLRAKCVPRLEPGNEIFCLLSATPSCAAIPRFRWSAPAFLPIACAHRSSSDSSKSLHPSIRRNAPRYPLPPSLAPQPPSGLSARRCPCAAASLAGFRTVPCFPAQPERVPRVGRLLHAEIDFNYFLLHRLHFV